MIQQAKLRWTDNGLPQSETFDDIYFAQEGGIEETEYVFLTHNQLPERWHQQPDFTITETGFGIGLNFLVTSQCYLDNTTQGQLIFISVEKKPLSLVDLKKAHTTLPSKFHHLAEQLHQDYPPPLPGIHLISIHPRIQLWLLLGDVIPMLSDLPPSCRIDAWFLDGFAPSKNPDMWTPTLFRLMARLSHESTTLATFTAASNVRKGLSSIGFCILRDKGFGPKREMLYGYYVPENNPFRHSQRLKKTHWLPQPRPTPACGHFAIIGGGIAGATIANRLANAGYRITLFEAETQMASLASGNLAGNCLPVIDRSHGIYAQWYWQAWLCAQRWWLQQQDHEQLGEFDGAWKWSEQKHTQQQWQAWISELNSPQWLDWQSVTDHNISAIWIERGGYLKPKAVVSRLLNHPNIQCHTATKITSWTTNALGINLITETGQSWQSWQADGLILATGAQSEQLLTEWTPYIQKNKGQVTHLHESNWMKSPKHPLSYQGYVTPAVNGITCIGATFEREASLNLTHRADDENIATLLNALPHALNHTPPLNEGHCAYRAMTHDHLPLVGPLIHLPDYQRLAQPYVNQPDTCPNLETAIIPNVWLTLGHGSRGLTSAFLAAELLHSQITGQPYPILNKVINAVHPARQIFRQMAQNALR